MFVLPPASAALPIRCLRLEWQLQHGGALACTNVRHQDDLAIREFQGVMMRAGIVGVYLSETGHAVTHRGSPPEKELKSGNYPFDLALKDNFCAGQQTDRYSRLSFSREATSRCIVKLRRDQLVPDLGRSGCNTV